MERNNKPTPVEWLVDELTKVGYIHAPHFGHAIIDKKIEQAKQMEREQRIDDYNVGYADATCRYPNTAFEHVDGKK